MKEARDSVVPGEPGAVGSRSAPTKASGENTRTSEASTAAIHFWRYNILLSGMALSFLAWLLLRQSTGDNAARFSFLPALNAGFNSLSALLLVYGVLAIRKGREVRHRYSMVGALASSACFLVGYMIYHYFCGDTPYAGADAWRVSYFVLLGSHIILSIVALPLVLATAFFALSGRRKQHRRLARYTLPIWLYVSVSGVGVYLVLHVV